MLTSVVRERFFELLLPLLLSLGAPTLVVLLMLEGGEGKGKGGSRGVWPGLAGQLRSRWTSLSRNATPPLLAWTRGAEERGMMLFDA